MLAETSSVVDQIVLGVLQGLTEFLPVSSSGHLIALEHWWGLEGEGSLVGEILLHFATLLSVLVVFRRDVRQLLLGIVQPGEGRRLLFHVILACIPAGVVGLALRKYIEHLPAQWPYVVPCCWLLTAALLLSVKSREGVTDGKPLCWRSALVIGCVQAFALLPGISRSGSTIVAALWLGVRRDQAASFSFLVSVPLIGGITLLTVKKLLETGASAPVGIVWGGLAAFVTGVAALLVLLRMLQRGALHWWGYYLIGIALLYGGWLATSG